MMTLANVILVRVLSLRFEAVLEFPSQSFLEVQSMLDFSVSALLGLQLGIIVRKFIK